MTDTHRQYAQIIWNYLTLRQDPKRSDLILVLCSNDLRVADYAADLFMQQYAPRILFTGGIAHTNDLLATSWDMPEAEKFAEVARKKGVPSEHILIEHKATNTGENIRFAYDLLQQHGIFPKTIILVQKPFMMRRALATYIKQWPDLPPTPLLCCPSISFDEYPNEAIDLDALIHTLVGDLQRMKEYAEKGFQIPEEIPSSVWEAYTALTDAGYTKHLLR